MSKKLFIAVVIVVAVLASLFYLFQQREDEDVNKTVNMTSQPIVSWQKTTITEAMNNSVININSPKIIIYDNYVLESKVNEAITQHIEYSKDWFISGVTTAAEDNGETNILNIETEVLLATPRLISLAFTSTEDLAGINNDDPKRTFMVFNLVNNKMVIEGNELFRDDIAWSRAAKMMKNYLLADYQGDPSCDLFFAPKNKGFAASCIGIDRSHRGKHLSITGDIPISMIQEFLAPSVLSDVIQ
ncbi:MAG: hypothetical protein HYS59_02440 [Candidatus Vogelbacteria bacterium]|nr:hypothetical protein [Candidatus Vogelbacteria bacterium]